MRKNILKQLIKINTLYMNPAYTDRERKKIKGTGKSIFGAVFRGSILPTLIVPLIYGIFLLMVDFQATPSALHLYLGFFLFMGFGQQFTLYYNFFYESKDVEEYRALPLKDEEVYFSKIVLMGLFSLGVLTPIFLLFLKFYWDQGKGLWFIPLSFYFFFTIAAVVILLNLLFMELLLQTAVVAKIRGGLVVAVNLFVQLASMAGILFISYGKDVIETMTAPSPFGTHPLATALILGGLIVVLSLGVYRICMKHYFIRGEAKATKKNHKKAKMKIQGRSLLRYNLKLVMDPTVLSSAVVTPGIFPLFMLLPQVPNLKNMGDMSAILGGTLLPGVVLGILTALPGAIMGVSLPSLYCSLDNENWETIQSMPIDEEKYLNLKVRASTLLMVWLPLLGTAGILLFFKLSLWNLLVSFGFILLTTYIASKGWICYDRAHMVTGWQNMMEIMNRIPKWFVFVTVFGFVAIFIAMGAGVALAYQWGLSLNLVAFFLGGGWLVILLIAYALILQKWEALGFR